MGVGTVGKAAVTLLSNELVIARKYYAREKPYLSLKARNSAQVLQTM